MLNDEPEILTLIFGQSINCFRKMSLIYCLEMNFYTRRSGERIGVCGRTGAGKSSLAVALFNMVESWEGKILLAGKDIRKMGLHTLR